MDWYGKARDIKPGAMFRHYGRGFMAREVATVASMCNCQAPHAYSLGGTPDQAIGHVPPEGRERAKHYNVLVVTPVQESKVAHGALPEAFTMLPHGDVCFTDDEW